MPAPHPLTPLLAPSSVAIFGASNDPTRISGRSLRYYREAGYKGALYPINPTRDHGAGAAGLSRHRRGPRAGRVRRHRGAGQSRGRGDGVLRRQGGQGGRHVHRRLCRDRRRGPRDAGPASRRSRSDSGIRLCGPNCLGLFNMRTGHTPTFSSFLEEGPTPAGPLGMVTQSGAFGTHLLALTARRGISGRRLAVDRQRGRRVGRRRHFVPRRRPRHQGDRLLCRGDQGRRAVRRGGGARPRQRQAGHRDEGRQLDGRRRGGGLAHRFAGRRRRDLRRRLPPARRRARQDARRTWSTSPMPAPAAGCRRRAGSRS